MQKNRGSNPIKSCPRCEGPTDATESAIRRNQYICSKCRSEWRKTKNYKRDWKSQTMRRSAQEATRKELRWFRDIVEVVFPHKKAPKGRA